MLKSSKSFILIIGLVLLLGTAGFAAWRAWWPTAAETDASSTSAGCTDSLALAVAQQDNAPAPRACISGEFPLDDTGKITVVDTLNKSIGKTYFVNADGTIQKVVDSSPSPLWLDLSLGSDNPDCKYLWTNDIWTIEQEKPDRITRSLITTGSSYRWKFELTNFNGQIPGDPKPPGCTRSGIFTVDLDGTDLQLIGAPTFQIPAP